MRRHWHYICVILSCVFCCGCTSPSMRQLEQLEAQLDSMPDAVCLALDSISFASLDTEEQALYAILRTQADYKCYVPLTTDTLIRYATDYYNNFHKNFRAAMAYYSLGCVYTELQNDAAAVEAYIKAQDLYPDTTIRYYSLCYQNLGRHYTNKKMYDEAMDAFMAFRRVATGYDSLYANLSVARTHIYKGEFDEADSLLDKMLQGEEHLDSTYLGEIFFERGKIEYTYRKNYNLADSLFLQALRCLSPIVNTYNPILWFLGNIAQKKNDTISAKQYYTNALKDATNDVYLDYNCIRNLMYLALDSLGYPEVYRLVKQFEELNDSINHREHRTEVMEILYRYELENQQRELEANHQRTVLFILMILLAVTASVIVWSQQLKTRRLRSFIQLQDELRANQIELHELKRKISETHQNEMSNENDRLLLQLYQKNLDGGIAMFKRETKWINQLRRLEVESITKTIQITDIDKVKLRTALFHCFSESVENLLAENVKLRQEDIVYCLLSSMHYSNRVIAVCLGITEAALRTRKTRLKDKISKAMLELFFLS